VSQLEAALDAQKSSVTKVFKDVSEAEKRAIDADKCLNQYLNTLEDAQLAISLQNELDKER